MLRLKAFTTTGSIGFYQQKNNGIEETELLPGIVVHACNPERQRQEDQEFKIILSYSQSGAA